MLEIPHATIAIVCGGLGVFIFALVGLSMFLKMWREYQSRYVEGAAVTLDAMYISMPPQNIIYLGFVGVLGICCVVTLLVGNLFVGLILGLPGFLLPRLVLYFFKVRRDKMFGFQLVDALMNVSNSLRAGFSLQQAFELIYREMPAPISQEMRLVCQELRLGVPMEEALGNLYKRMPSQDVDLMVTAIAIVSDVGGNLTEVFDNIAGTIRERHRIEGKISALTAQGKLQAIVVCCLPFFVGGGLHLMAPKMFEKVYTTPAGWVIIGGILLMELVGALFIRKIIRIDV